MRYARAVMILAALLCLFMVSGAAAQTADTNTLTLDGIRNNFALAKANITRLESIRPWLLTFALLTILLGLASAALQFINKTWVKVATGIIGAIIFTVGTLKTTIFRIDYATCDSMLLQVKSLVQLAELDIAEYQGPYISADAKEAVWNRLVRNEQTLEKYSAVLRDAGQPIMPSFVVYAQSNQAAQRAPIRFQPITQQGSVIANDGKAGYKFARYDALERLALRASPPPRGAELGPVIAYLSRVAEPRQSDCSPTKDRMFLCRVSVSVPALQLNWDVMKQFTSGNVSPAPPPTLRGAAIVKLPVAGPVTVKVEGAGSFEMGFTPDSSTKPPSLRLVSIQCADDGIPGLHGASPWTFEISAGQGTTFLPLNDYDGSGHPTLYWVDSDQPHRVSLPESGRQARITIIGYRPPAASAR